MRKKKNKRQKRKTKIRSEPTIKRDVYIMERISFGSIYDFIRYGRRHVKIGISNNSDRRLREVRRDIPGLFFLNARYVVPSASKVETELHTKFNDFNFKPNNAVPGSGSTEFYKLKTSQIWEAKGILNQASEKDRPGFLFWITFLIILFYLIRYHTQN